MPDLVQGIYVGWHISYADLLVLAAQMNLSGPGPEDTGIAYGQDVALELGAQARVPVYATEHGEDILISVFWPTPFLYTEMVDLSQGVLRLAQVLGGLGASARNAAVGIDQREVQKHGGD